MPRPTRSPWSPSAASGEANCTHSDIDLLILTRDGIDGWQEDLGAFVTLLWDLHLDMGKASRLEESLQAARDDVTILTNLLETRTIAGPDELRKKLSDTVYSDAVCTDGDYFIAKREEQKQRHKKYGDTEYNLEPNIKGAPGGLRDIQTIGWITKRHFGLQSLSDLARFSILTEEEHQILVEGETFLWQLRFGLQLIADRNENRLLFDHQRALAEMLGYRDQGKRLGVELMMQAYYRTVLASELADVIRSITCHSRYGGKRNPALNKRFRSATNMKHQYQCSPTPPMRSWKSLLMAQHPDQRHRATTIRSRGAPAPDR